MLGWLMDCSMVDSTPVTRLMRCLLLLLQASFVVSIQPAPSVKVISHSRLIFTTLYDCEQQGTACTRKLDYCNSLDYVYGLWGLLLDFLRYSFLLFLVPLVTFLFWLRFLYVNSTHYLIVCSSLNLYYVCTVFYLYNNSRLLYALGFL